MQDDRHSLHAVLAGALAGTDLADLRASLDTRSAAAWQAVEALSGSRHQDPGGAGTFSRERREKTARQALSVDAALDFALAFVTARG